ncbi:hypothetical protein ACHQM5_014561 [Ranunculus cassubicifolius]
MLKGVKDGILFMSTSTYVRLGKKRIKEGKREGIKKLKPFLLLQLQLPRESLHLRKIHTINHLRRLVFLVEGLVHILSWYRGQKQHSQG